MRLSERLFRLRWPIVLLLFAVLGVNTWLRAAKPVRPRTDWPVFVAASRALLAGEDPYDARARSWWFINPPPAALFGLPFTVLPPAVSALAWFLLQAGLFALLLRAASGLAESDRARWGIAAAGALATAAGWLELLTRGQVFLVPAAAIALAFLALSRGREEAGGALLGFAAATKLLPLLFLPWLLHRRRFRAAAAMCAAAVAVTLLPAVVVGPAGALRLVRRFVEVTVSPAVRGDGTGRLVGQLHDLSLRRNQSAAAVFHRAGRAISRDGALDGAMRATALVAVGVLGAALLLAARRAPRRPPPLPLALEIGAVSSLMLSASPVAWDHYFVALALPAVALAEAARRGSRTAGRALVVATLLGAVFGFVPGGREAGALFAANLVLYAAMLRGLAQACGGDSTVSGTTTPS